MNDEEKMTELYEEIDKMEFPDDTKFVFKCKPTYQFQSIEFEVTASKYDINRVLGLYKQVLDGLIQISPEQEKHASKPVEDLATDKQKATMRKFNIKFNDKTTAAEAQKMIKISLEKSLSE